MTSKKGGHLIYVASPYKAAPFRTVAQNEAFAREICREIALDGNIPIAPHLYFTQFLNDSIEHERLRGIRFGRKLMEFCDEIRLFVPAGMKMSDGMCEEWLSWNKGKAEVEER